jgi:hypothetical protein
MSMMRGDLGSVKDCLDLLEREGKNRVDPITVAAAKLCSSNVAGFHACDSIYKALAAEREATKKACADTVRVCHVPMDWEKKKLDPREIIAQAILKENP